MASDLPDTEAIHLNFIGPLPFKAFNFSAMLSNATLRGRGHAGVKLAKTIFNDVDIPLRRRCLLFCIDDWYTLLQLKS